MVDERFPPSPVTGRCRRRGPRSLQAIARRVRTSNERRQPPSGTLGESGHVPLELDTKITILSLNIRGFLSHQIELETFLRMHGSPSIVGITETLLDASTQNIKLSRYTLVSRLDRRVGFAKSGGIALFVLDNVARPC